MAGVTVLAGCSGGDAELVRSSLPGPGPSGPAAIEVVGHESAGFGRAVAAASLDTPRATVVATTSGVYVLGDGDPRPLDAWTALTTPIDVAIAPDGKLAAVALASPAAVRWYDLTAEPPVALATTDLGDDQLAAIEFAGNGVLVGQSGSAVLSWPGGPTHEPARLADSPAGLGRSALLPHNQVVVPLAGTDEALIGPVEGPLRSERAAWADGGTLADAQATPGGTLAFSVTDGSELFERDDTVVIVDAERWEAVGTVATGTALSATSWALSDTHVGVVGSDGAQAFRLDGSAAAPLGDPPSATAERVPAATTAMLGTSHGFVTIAADDSIAFWDGARLDAPIASTSVPSGARSIERMGDTVGIVSQTGEIAVWNATTGAEVLAEHRFATGEFTAVAAVDGGPVAVGSTIGKAFLFDAALAPGGTVDEAGRRIDAVAFVPGTTDLVTALAARVGQFAFDDSVSRWSPSTTASPAASPTAPTTLVAGQGQDVEGCAFFYNRLRFSPDGQQLAVIRHTFEVQLVDPATGAVAHTFEPHASTVLDVAFTDDGHLVTAADDALVRVWNTGDHSLAAEYQAMAGGYQSIVALADGAMAVTDIIGTVWVVDVLTGDVRAQLPDATFRGAHLAASPDRQMLAVPTPEGGVTLWSVADQQPLATLFGPNQPVSDVTFAGPSTVVAASTDGTVHRWTLASP